MEPVTATLAAAGAICGVICTYYAAEADIEVKHASGGEEEGLEQPADEQAGAPHRGSGSEEGAAEPADVQAGAHEEPKTSVCEATEPIEGADPKKREVQALAFRAAEGGA